MNGSTDKGNAGDEVFMVVWCDTRSSDEKIQTKIDYFHVCRPNKVDALGLFESHKLSATKRILSRYGAYTSSTIRG